MRKQILTIIAMALLVTGTALAKGNGEIGSTSAESLKATVRISNDRSCAPENLTDFNFNGVCSKSCESGWHGVDSAVCGACEAGAGFINAGMNLAQASQLCVQTLRNSADTLVQMHQKGLLDETSIKSGEAENALVSVCVGAAARYKVQCVL
jgi:hypothetical protein